MLFIAHAHMLFQVPTLCVWGGGGGGAMALKRLHICAGSTKPLLLVYTHAVRHLHVPSHVTYGTCGKSSFKHECAAIQ